MTDDLVKEMRRFSFHDRINEKPWEAVELIDAAAARIEELERALRGKDNIAFIIDSHGIAHRTFTVIYTGEKTND